MVGLETVCAVKDHFQNLIFYQHYYVILVQLVFGVFFFILLKCNFIKNTFKFLVQNKTWCSGFDYHLRTAYSKSIYLLYIGLTLCDLPVEVLLKIFSFLHLPDFLTNLLPIRKRFLCGLHGASKTGSTTRIYWNHKRLIYWSNRTAHQLQLYNPKLIISSKYAKFGDIHNGTLL